MSDDGHGKDLVQAAKLSVQSRATEVGEAGPGLFWALVSTGGILPPWWSKRRDQELRAFWKESDHLASAFYAIAARLSSVPFRVEPRDPDIKGHWKQADQFESVLAEESDFGMGWQEFWTKWLVDLWSQDNGAFAEVIGAGSPTGPIRGPAVGLAHLDAYRCQRTGNPEYPVLYEDEGGTRYKLHRSRVVYAAQLPDPRSEMKGVGLCWASRCAGMAQHLADVVQYVQEKLGSRPYRGIIYGSGTGAVGDLLVEAVNAANEAADNANLARYARTPVVLEPNLTLGLLDLSSLPDGFDFQTSTTLGIYTIAEAGGFPPRWIWPATVTGATKADAMYQHQVGTMAGAAATLRQIQLLLGGDPEGQRSVAAKFLPPHLKLVFDFQDDEQDRSQAEIRDVRSTRHERDLNSGVIDLRTARQQMLDDGDLTDAQFAALELADGRTEEGDDLLDLFYRGLPLLAGIDPRNPNLALAEERLVEAKKAIIAATGQQAKKDAQLSEAALRWLIKQEEEPEQEAVRAQPEEIEEEAGEEPEGETEEEEEEEKATLGPGRGWWAPPLGTHGPGSQGGKVEPGGGGGEGKPSPQPGTASESIYSRASDERAQSFLADGLGIDNPSYASNEMRGIVKQEIVDDLVKRTGLESNEVNVMVAQWARTSGDDTLRSLELQMATAKVNGIKPDKYLQERYDKAMAVNSGIWSGSGIPPSTQQALSWADVGISQAKVETFVKGVQSHTHEQLIAKGFKPTDKITLYRGYRSKEYYSMGQKVEVPLNPLSSWSSSSLVGAQFAGGPAGVMVKMDVPITSIFSTARTGMGCLSEHEFIVLGISGHEAAIVQSGGG